MLGGRVGGGLLRGARSGAGGGQTAGQRLSRALAAASSSETPSLSLASVAAAVFGSANSQFSDGDVHGRQVSQGRMRTRHGRGRLGRAAASP